MADSMTSPRYKTPRDPRQSQLLNGCDWQHGIHPDAPAGGGGPGYFTSRKPYGDSLVIAFHSHTGPMDAKESALISYLDHSFDRPEMKPSEKQAYIRREKELKQLRACFKRPRPVLIASGYEKPTLPERSDRPRVGIY
jgi:hypothetical protein